MAKASLVKKTVYSRKSPGGKRKTRVVIRKKHNKPRK